MSFETKSAQTDADGMISEKSSLGGDSFGGYDYYRDRSILNPVIIRVVLRQIMIFQRRTL